MDAAGVESVELIKIIIYRTKICKMDSTTSRVPLYDIYDELREPKK